MRITEKFTNPSSGRICSSVGYLRGNTIVYTEDVEDRNSQSTLHLLGLTASRITSVPLSVEVENAKDYKDGDRFLMYFNISNREGNARGQLLAIVSTQAKR